MHLTIPANNLKALAAYLERHFPDVSVVAGEELRERSGSHPFPEANSVSHSDKYFVIEQIDVRLPRWIIPIFLIIASISLVYGIALLIAAERAGMETNLAVWFLTLPQALFAGLLAGFSVRAILNSIGGLANDARSWLSGFCGMYFALSLLPFLLLLSSRLSIRFMSPFQG